ncbi:hypothetical protein K2X85_11345 [bacterium]|nr:hypothetical protein [bacterium]
MSSEPSDDDSENRLPADWKSQRDSYDRASAVNYARILRGLRAVGSMSSEECERAAFVLVEKENCLRKGLEYEND